MPTEPNPFSLLYTKLWELLLSDATFAAMVKPGNRISFDGTSTADPQKEHISHADLPEVLLSVSGLSEGNLHATSSTTKIKRRYTFVISTGSWQLNEYLQKVQWHIFCAMCDFKRVLMPLQFNGAPFVKNVNLIDSTDGWTDKTKNRSINGFTSIWGCEVEMHFKTSDLIAETGE